ncbi:hypothetical protein CC80DRAFT_316029 [Byssothecium circinans]|uniref:Uncharacterized protein n=1 Tax=Byssothecium circinans TaxID=147558 RepID=A0A6A5T749_9PLEO|nr:hypothetical protein CC80DRAFT_316029 [Byssothecium circinans]
MPSSSIMHRYACEYSTQSPAALVIRLCILHRQQPLVPFPSSHQQPVTLKKNIIRKNSPSTSITVPINSNGNKAGPTPFTGQGSGVSPVNRSDFTTWLASLGLSTGLAAQHSPSVPRVVSLQFPPAVLCKTLVLIKIDAVVKFGVGSALCVASHEGQFAGCGISGFLRFGSPCLVLGWDRSG